MFNLSSTKLKHKMKLKLFIISLVLLVFTQSIAQKKNVALVSFYCDKKIGGTGLGTAIESLIKDPAFDLSEMVNKSYARFIDDYSSEFPFALIDKNTIVNDQSYKTYHSQFLADTSNIENKLLGIQYAIAKDFIFAFGSSPQGIIKDKDWDPCNLAKIFPQADGVLFVSMDFEFETRLMGLGAGIRASLNLSLFDAKCKKVFRIRETAPSKKKVPAIGGIPVMDPAKIQPLCQDALDELFNDLKGRLPKIVKKSDKL
jgi:hypothetical protein